MALVRCLECEAVREVGFTPSGSCGMFIVLPIGAAFACAALATRAAWDAWGWWALVLPLPVFWATAVVGFHLIMGLPRAFEYLLANRRSCERCGARRWSSPYTDGFGP